MNSQCEACKRSMYETALYRVNEKGVAAVWRCEKCVHIKLDHDLVELVHIIEEGMLSDNSLA